MTSNDQQPKAPKNYFSLQLFVLRCAGINIFEIKDPFRRTAYNVYAFLMILNFYVAYTAFELQALYANRKNLDNLTPIFRESIIHVMGCIKLVLFLMKRKNLKEYLLSIEEGVFIPDVNRGGEEEFKIIKRAIRVANIYLYLFYGLACVVVSNIIIYTINDPGFTESTFDPATNETTTQLVRALPCTTWFWFDTRPTPNYQFAFFYQIWCMSTFGVGVGVIDSVCTGMLLHLNAQFKILNNAVMTVVERARRMQMTDSKRSLNNGQFTDNSDAEITTEPEFTTEGWEIIPLMGPELRKKLKLRMFDCLKHHNKIIFLSDKFEEQFNMMVLVQFFGTTLIVCFQMFQLSFISILSLKFLSMFMYLILMIYQLTIYCYTGNEISLQSEEISKAAYNTEWFGAENDVKKSLILMMVRAQRPIKLSAGKIAFLSLATLVNIIRGSYSYYMVLTNMKE